jgi:hypothetical protein
MSSVSPLRRSALLGTLWGKRQGGQGAMAGCSSSRHYHEVEEGDLPGCRDEAGKSATKSATLSGSCLNLPGAAAGSDSVDSSR